MVHPDSIKIVAIIAAAGFGKRLGKETPKQFLEISKKPILVHALEKFDRCSAIDKVIVVVQANEVDRTTLMLRRWKIQKTNKVVIGGPERQDSVQNGLEVIPESAEIVVVHDAVRPFVSVKKIMKVVDAARDDGAAILAIPVKDTIKQGSEGWIEKTLRRDRLWSVQTPQGFRIDWLKEGYAKAQAEGFYATDDSALVERLGYRVRIVEGEEQNIKITSPLDLFLAGQSIRGETR